MDCKILKVISFSNGEVRLYDSVCFAEKYPMQSNVIFYDLEGHPIWSAELPSAGELYIGMGRELEGIWCGTLNSVVCTLDLTVGRILTRKIVH